MSKSIIYIGSSDFRHFTPRDAVGVELSFAKGQAQEVNDGIASLLLLDKQFQGEFVEASESDSINDSIDAQRVPHGLLSESESDESSDDE